MTRLYSLCIAALICLTIVLSMPDAALAQANDGDAQPTGTCTTDPGFAVPASMQIITGIIDNITCVLYGQAADASCRNTNSVSEAMFKTITINPSYVTVIQATASLFVIIFAISFMMGIVQLTMVEFTIRTFKLSLVLAFVLGGFDIWGFFYNTVGVFFQNGTNWFISLASQIAIGTVPGVDVSKPFTTLDYAIATAFSAKMFVTVMAMFFTGPYGWLFFILTVLGIGSFVAAIFQGIWIYLMSMVIRAFLFGLAPIFIVFLLFNRTRSLFDGWLNQLVNSMLQPVLLFTFFSFFVILVQAAMENILKVPVCYMSGVGIFKGAPGDLDLPRFSIENIKNGTYEPYTGEWGFSGAIDEVSKTFPIDVVDVLIFVLLTQLAWRFNGIAINIAKELAGVSTVLNAPGAFTGMLSPAHAARHGAMDAANKALIDQNSVGKGQGALNAIGGNLASAEPTIDNKASAMTGMRGGIGGNSGNNNNIA